MRGASQESILTSKERARRIAFALWVTLALNLAVASIKIVFGWITNTTVIMADGFHSLSDGTSNIIGLIGITLAAHPADKEHPYGHQKFETMASIAIGAMLLLVSFGIIQRAILGFSHPRFPEVSLASFAVMTLTLVVNLIVVGYERTVAKKCHSELLWSDSWHTLTDVFISLGVFAALIGLRMNLWILDPLFSLVIGGVIGLVGLHILKDSSNILTDKAVLDPAQVSGIVKKIKGIEDCHEIRTRGKMHAIYVDLHVLVDPRMSVEESHRLANQIECAIKEGIEGVFDVVVHIEPTNYDHTDQKIG